MTSCGDNNQTNIDKVSVDNQTQTLSLDTFSFSKLPEEIDGCSCRFSATIEDQNKNEFIYVNDLAQYSFISVDKKIIKLTLMKSDTLSKNKYRITYGNKDFELILEKCDDQKYEVPIIEGTLFLKAKDGRTFKTNYFGECGC